MLLRATLAVERQSVGATEPALVLVSIQNVSQEPLSVLTWYTPLEGVLADIFAVERDGHAVSYRGPLATRGLPTPKHYLRLAPGESATAVVDLATLYDLDEPGTYRVRLRAQVFDLGNEQTVDLASAVQRGRPLRPRPLGSNDVSFVQSSPRTPSPEPLPLSLRTAIVAPTFEHCSETQKATVEKALDKARTQAALAAIGLAFLPEAQRPVSPRLKKWFGAYDRGRYEGLVHTFVKIYNGLANQQISFNCSPEEKRCWSTTAYVFALDPFRVYLCDQYFYLPDDGLESKPAILIHEMSHFEVIAGTVDYKCGGRTTCEALAATDPWGALDSADNYRFFAENIPYVPLRTDE